MRTLIDSFTGFWLGMLVMMMILDYANQERTGVRYSFGLHNPSQPQVYFPVAVPGELLPH